MTREYEFRAKRVDTKEWIFGYYYNSLGEFPCIIETSQEGYVDDALDVIPETVGQLWATINNNKYFEGDIFSVGLFANMTYVIIYNGIKKCVSFIQISEYKKLKRGDKLSRLNILSNLGYAKVELIEKYSPTLLGNIFDNPELLK